MPRKSVRIEKSNSELRLIPEPETKFQTDDAIYFSTVLPGDRIRTGEGFVFDLERLGTSGLSDLKEYLDAHDYGVSLDASSKSAFDALASQRHSLEKALQAGAKLKKRPKQRFEGVELRRQLKPFQIPAVAHMVGVENSANFSVPGSGKTAIAIAAFARLFAIGALQKLVVIGPRAAFAPWEHELQASLGDGVRTLRVTGNREQRAEAWAMAEDASVVLLNYHVASNDHNKLKRLLSETRAMLVLDESHHIKSITNSKWVSAISAAAPFATRRVVLSGTPAPNSLLDLWSQFNFLYPEAGLLGTREEFIFALETDQDAANTAVKQKIWPLFWRIKKVDLKLPRPTVKKLCVDLGEVQTAIYCALATKVLKDSKRAPVDIEKLKVWRRARLIRLLQAASNPTLLGKYSHEFKIPPMAASGLSVTELIERYPDFEVPAKILSAVSVIRQLLEARRKVVLWTSFVHNIKMLLKLLEDCNPLPLYGGIPLSEDEGVEFNRESIINRFISDPAYPVLIANPAACAESISLHSACTDAVYLDRTFNCAHFLQSKDRIHRVGLARSARVNYYIILAKETVDEVVDSRLLIKQERMLRLLETDFGNVNLDLGEDVVSEEPEEEIDFAQTLKHIASLVQDDWQS